MAIPLITAPNLSSIKGLIHGFTTRIGGVSVSPYASCNLGMATGDEDDSVRRNYRLLADELGTTVESFLGLRQMHGGDVVVADPEASASDPLEAFRFAPSGDAIVTDHRGVLLFARVADCFPILLVDERNGAIGAVHAGWRGTLARVIPNAVRRMSAEFGTDPADLTMAVGPGIGLPAFEVSVAIAEMFEEQLDAQEGEIVKDEVSAQIDLAAILIRQARGEGIRADRIWSCGFCTHGDPGRFFSYRREGRRTGRMIGFIGWRS
ncbi:MAG: peptidoglycan editing factor PgeF [Pseudomonadota bacterium]